MQRKASLSLVAVMALTIGLIAASHAFAQTATERREAAVMQARAGHMAKAQSELRGMLSDGIDDGLVAMDLATLLQQDRKPREAVRVFEKATPANPPEYALLAVTRAYRDLRRFKDAERVARQGQTRFPDQPVWPLLLSLVLSDAHHAGAALEVLRQPAVKQAPTQERLLAEAYAWRRAGNWQQAETAYSEVLRTTPPGSSAHQEATKALREHASAARARKAKPTKDEDDATALARVERQLAKLGSRLGAEGQRRRLQREAAVLKARTGKMTEAQMELRAIVAAGEDVDRLAAMDLVTLLQQDGKHAEAVATFEAASAAAPPDYALLSAARAYRDLQRYADAERLARQGLQRFHRQPVWPLLLSLILSDAGRLQEALGLLRQAVAQRASSTERLLAEAYAWRRAGDPYKAIDLYTTVLKDVPGNREARVEAAAAMQGLAAPFGAAEVAGTHLPFADDEAAAMVRWGAQIRPSEPEHRFDGTDAALIRLDAVLAALPRAPAEAARRRQLRLDRLVALRDRVRMREVVEEGEALRAEAPLPQYAEEAFADALLYIRRPEEALASYRRVLEQSPQNVEARYGQFYAAVEMEDFETAYATVDALVADEPVWRRYGEDASRLPNPERASAEVTAAQARFYGNQLGNAWDRISALAAAAPASGSARLALYQVANARGWPYRATAEGEIATSLDPRDVHAKIALVEISLANYHFADAERQLRELLIVYPENTAVQRLAHDVDAASRWLFESEAKPADSTGGGANASGRSLTTRGKLTSPPINDSWRLFAAHDYANAHPPEGFVERSRVSAGLEWRSPGATATIFPSQSFGTLNKPGLGGTLDLRPTDEIGIGLAAERYSWETPLRAILHGITADEISAAGAYRWHESRSLDLRVAYQPFTDGNQRFSGGATFKERLINLPGFDVTGSVESYASGNSLRNAPYYNPRRDLSVSGGILVEHMLWRRYENSLVQALKIDGGLYSEAGYRDNWIGTINYEHRWRFDPLTSFRYGVQFSRRVYDGSVEKSLTLVLGLSRRF